MAASLHRNFQIAGSLVSIGLSRSGIPIRMGAFLHFSVQWRETMSHGQIYLNTSFSVLELIMFWIPRTSGQFFQPTLKVCPCRFFQIYVSNAAEDYGLGHRAAVFAPLLGDSISTQEGNAWRSSRDQFRKHLHQIDLQNLDDAFGSQVDSLISRIPVQGVINLQPLFFALTMDITTALILGDSVNSLQEGRTDKDAHFAENFNTAQEGLAKRFRLGAFYFFYNPASFRRACRSVHDFIEDCIGRADSSEFLDQLAAGARSDTALRSQLLNILIAGRDSTACCLSWCL